MTRLILAVGLASLALVSWPRREKCPRPTPHAPSCATLGCPLAPSGSCVSWTPCRGRMCYCGNPPVACERGKDDRP